MPRRLALWQWYWIDGRATSNDYAAKLPGNVGTRRSWRFVCRVIIYTPTETDEPQARAALQAFTVDMRETIASALGSCGAMKMRAGAISRVIPVR
jgi:hypothetical protein